MGVRHERAVRRWSGAMAVALLAAACGARPPVTGPPAPGPAFVEVPAGAWPELADDGDPAELAAACRGSVAYLERLPGDRVVRFGEHQRSPAALAAGVARFRERAAAAGRALAARLAAEFVLLRSSGRDGAGEVLFTAYFEPLLEGRRAAEGDFRHPIYALPDDLVSVDLAAFGVEAEPRRLVGRVAGRALVPYWDREAIDWGGAVTATAAPLAFLADPVALFFLHVQGSGTVRFPDGELLRAGYAATNGRPYRSIGKLLIDEGLVPAAEMSMQAIEAYLVAHPEELRRVLSANPSYVFFRPLDAAGGPLGCFEIPLTAGRSIATDRRLVPAPVPAFVRTSLPSPDGSSERPLARFVLNQDTGGSIVGPGRVDLFLGRGAEAGAVAGRTKHRGELFILLPR